MIRITHPRTVRHVCLILCLLLLVICSDLLRATKSASVAVISQQGPEIVGQWSSVISLPLVTIHMHLLPTGKVLLYQDDNNRDYPINATRLAGYTVAYVWDVGTGALTQVDNTTNNEFCAGHAFLPDGRLLIVGGLAEQNAIGTRDAFIFDSSSKTWVQTNQPMSQGRWYPSAVTLANGEIAVVSGRGNDTPEIWQTNSGGGWRVLSNATLNLFLYPYMHLAPNGKVFVSGPEVTTRYLDTSGTGTWSTVATRVVNSDRDYGSSVTYDVGKIVIIGGGDPPLNSAEIIDLNQSSPAWSMVGSMAFARRQMNATLLPDGKVLVTGGTSSLGFNEAAGTVLAAEMWNPQTGNFTTMASMQKPRLYHSTAILLPDGRVLSAGGGRGSRLDEEQRNAEIYSPPYLFTSGGAVSVRPTIDSHLSKGVRPGQTIFVTTPEAASIASVTLVGLSSVTHARNMNQRFNRLTFTQGAGGLNVTMPADANMCPPGSYMLFILNSNGVPSLAQFINVRSSNPLPPSPPPNLAATAVSTSSVSLSWGAASGSVDHYEIQRSANRNGPFTTLTPTTATSFTDNVVNSGVTYIYRVRAVDGQTNYSGFSNTDIATTIAFTDATLVPGSTIVKAQHINELRQAVNAVRLAAGLSEVSWTDNSLSGVIINVVHINQLRSNLDQALSLLGVQTSSYTDPGLTPTVTVVKTVHVQELRDRVK